jgi:hypothetical protein
MSTKGWTSPDLAEHLRGWLAGRLPRDWFEGPPEIDVDREEITVIGMLPAAAETAGAGTPGDVGTGPGQDTQTGAGALEADGNGPAGDRAGGEGASPAGQAVAAALGRARRFREETREARIEIAREIEHTFSRKVSWGVMCGGQKVMFTTLSVPVMTRLRQAERRVLDTLVDAGVARSRSDALAWCVRLVGEHEDSWLAELRAALRRVEEVRAAGPQA